MEDLLKCPLTGIRFDHSYVKIPSTRSSVIYEFVLVGKVEISTAALVTLEALPKEEKIILASIYRRAFLLKKELPAITTDLLNSNFKETHKVPTTKKGKARSLLRLMYDLGGDDLEKFKFSSESHFTCCFCINFNEFEDVLEYLEDEYWIEVGNDYEAGMGKVYIDIKLTKYGIEEVQKELPNLPMHDLVNQEIETGDSKSDEIINNAKRLFFKDYSMENMRSACESLSFVLEPLRSEVKSYFSSRDVEDFFNIVNNFDIRHNKSATKQIVHPEQLEWIFYSLLNTINTYSKLKKKLNP